MRWCLPRRGAAVRHGRDSNNCAEELPRGRLGAGGRAALADAEAAAGGVPRAAKDIVGLLAGLRLAICQAIVEAHGGSIAVAATSGEGTTMRVCLSV